MIVKRTSIFYRLTSLFGLTFDRLLRRKHYAKMFTTRWDRGQVDICSLGRAWLFGGGYYLAWLAIIGLVGYFIFVYPYADMPFDVGTRPALWSAAKMVALLLAFGAALFAILWVTVASTWLGGKAVSYIKKRRQMASVAKAFREQPENNKPPNPFVEALTLRYKAFKEATCFFVGVDDPKLNKNLGRRTITDFFDH